MKRRRVPNVKFKDDPHISQASFGYGEAVKRRFCEEINLGQSLSIMEAPTLDTTPALAPSRTSSLAPQPPPSPGTPGTPSTPIARPARGGKAKARDLLRQHYGMTVGPQAPLPGRANDPMNTGWCPSSSVSSSPLIRPTHLLSRLGII